MGKHVDKYVLEQVKNNACQTNVEIDLKDAQEIKDITTKLVELEAKLDELIAKLEKDNAKTADKTEDKKAGKNNKNSK